ncbi:butyrate kinase [Capillimicrobium parvum]|uniref:Probable butyrate kinase n=1 Tax=Capillimicrobium parvum TaxID=2884022 RepID=A0A9E6XX53_9ACTN|nr:butyrate kinase [Capillimicrobium parvum]UGS36152.1 Butyrate kinase 2 [Capillimicrobium parvum]
MTEPLILAVNPGSSSTKVALFAGGRELAAVAVGHDQAQLDAFRGRPILDQLPMRAAAIRAWLETQPGVLAAVVGRGGLLPPLASGTYRVDAAMLELLERHERGEHASNLGAFLAQELAAEAGVDAFVVDPVAVDEWPAHIRLSGHPALPRECLSHALNTKAVAKRFARETGRRYEDLRLIVAHLGSGISISSHAGGRMIDVTNSREEGAFSPERAGGVPAMALVELCFSGRHDRRAVEDMLFREGGLLAYLGTRDVAEALRRADLAGDAEATLVIDAMIHQITREIGAAAAPLRGRVDAILLTGGMAHAAALTAAIAERVDWIAPVNVHPGEDELAALAEGALRVLRGEEEARAVGGRPHSRAA